MVAVPRPLVERLMEARRRYSFPSQIRPLAQSFCGQVLGALFPHFGGSVACGEAAVVEDVLQLQESLARLLRAIAAVHGDLAPDLPARFLERLTEIHARLQEDADAIYYGDPAAKSVDEVILTYPGFFAIAVYRVAHELTLLGVPLLPRLLTEYAHEKTGVDIHPGATIGRRFMIDHGTGVVVGETAVVGHGVKLYQGVTLGATTVEKELADKKRHPTIEDNVVIYAGATILGGNTVIGHDSVVGGNAWLTQSVPPFSLVSRRSEVRSRQGGSPGEDLEFVI